MSNRVIACIVDGQIAALPNGDTPIDAGGNVIVGGGSVEWHNIDCSTNPDYPTSDVGHYYKVTVAGLIGGSVGIAVEVGDVLIPTTTTSEGDHATVGANWVILNKNILDTNASLRHRYVLQGTIYLDGQNQLTSQQVIDLTSPIAGYIVATSCKSRNARTAGSCVMALHKNGTGLSTTDLNLTISDVNTTKANASVAYNTTGYAIGAGDTVGVIATTSGFAPLNNIIQFIIVIEG